MGASFHTKPPFSFPLAPSPALPRALRKGGRVDHHAVTSLLPLLAGEGWDGGKHRLSPTHSILPAPSPALPRALHKGGREWIACGTIGMESRSSHSHLSPSPACGGRLGWGHSFARSHFSPSPACGGRFGWGQASSKSDTLNLACPLPSPPPRIAQGRERMDCMRYERDGGKPQPPHKYGSASPMCVRRTASARSSNCVACALRMTTRAPASFASGTAPATG